jgi:Zn-dependent protease with chaperone function
MSYFVFAVSAVALWLPAGLAPAFRRIAPKHSTFLSASLLAMGILLLEVTLILTGLPTMLRSFQLRSLADLCEQLVGHASPANAVLGWASLGAASLVAIRVVRSIRQSMSAASSFRVERWVGVHERGEGFELVVLPVPGLLAYSLPGRTPQVVVSRGLKSTLSSGEFQAVVRHERAHLELHHRRWMLIGAMTLGVLGRIRFVRRSVAVLMLNVERWADEAAATVFDDRRILYGALQKVAEVVASPAVGFFSRADTIAERLDALRTPLPESRGLASSLLVGVVLLAVLSAGFVGDWVSHTPVLALSIPYCPV